MSGRGPLEVHGSRGVLAALVVLMLLGAVFRSARAGAAPKPAAVLQRVNVRVVEVAGGRAYLTPGAKRHVRVGDSVRIGRRSYAVLAANAENVVVALDRTRLVRGDRGFVMVRPPEEKGAARRAPPRSLAALAGAWPALRPPASTQRPRFVPLGVMHDSRRNRAFLSLEHQRIQPLSGGVAAIGRTRLRAALHAELSRVPLGVDADGFAEFWQAEDLDLRPENASRPFISVRQLELRYRGEVVQGAAGRLRHASRTLGMLDGARVSGVLAEDWALSAFGGVLANPRDGSFETQASRFGAEIGWRDEDSAARPVASLTLQGSRFEERIDERRVTGILEAYPELGRFGARGEVSFFDADNPWAAAPAELTALGADAAIRVDSLRLGLAFDMRRPERSRWLDAFLPRGYSCVERAVAGATGAEPCSGGEQRYSASMNAGWHAPLWSLDAGGTYATSSVSEAEQATLFAAFQRRELAGPLRLDTSATLSRGSILESAALNLGAGAPFWNDGADLSLYYRPSITRYNADQAEFWEHGVGARIWWAPSHELDLSGSADVLVGRDADVLLLHVGASYRPRF